MFYCESRDFSFALSNDAGFHKYIGLGASSVAEFLSSMMMPYCPLLGTIKISMFLFPIFIVCVIRLIT